jgi:hypothetical protein
MRALLFKENYIYPPGEASLLLPASTRLPWKKLSRQGKTEV